MRTDAPLGAAVVTRPDSSWTGNLVAALCGNALHRRTLSDSQVTGEQVLLDGTHGGLGAVIEGPDSAVYVTTSNRDGRGSPREGDDRILRVVPPRG